MRDIILKFLLFVLCSILGPRAVFAVSVGSRLNTYTVFNVRQLAVGKNVTVGKYVLAYVPLGENIAISAANPPQNIDVRLQWLNSKKDHQSLKILGDWDEADRKLNIGIHLAKRLHASAGAIVKNTNNKNLILVTGRLPNQISLPLMAGRPINIVSDIKKFGTFAKNIRIVVSSNRAFQIAR